MTQDQIVQKFSWTRRRKITKLVFAYHDIFCQYFVIIVNLTKMPKISALRATAAKFPCFNNLTRFFYKNFKYPGSPSEVSSFFTFLGQKISEEFLIFLRFFVKISEKRKNLRNPVHCRVKSFSRSSTLAL
jgi:hypothetical protein